MAVAGGYHVRRGQLPAVQLGRSGAASVPPLGARGQWGSAAGRGVQLPLQPCGQPHVLAAAEVSGCAGAGDSPGCSAFCSCAQRGWSLGVGGGVIAGGTLHCSLGLLRGGGPGWRFRGERRCCVAWEVKGEVWVSMISSSPACSAGRLAHHC